MSHHTWHKTKYSIIHDSRIVLESNNGVTGVSSMDDGWNRRSYHSKSILFQVFHMIETVNIPIQVIFSSGHTPGPFWSVSIFSSRSLLQHRLYPRNAPCAKLVSGIGMMDRRLRALTALSPSWCLALRWASSSSSSFFPARAFNCDQCLFINGALYLTHQVIFPVLEHSA